MSIESSDTAPENVEQAASDSEDDSSKTPAPGDIELTTDESAQVPDSVINIESS